MFQGPNKSKRKSQEQSDKNPQQERSQLIEQITKLQNNLSIMDKRIADQHHKHQKMVQSNVRNQKRLMRYRAKMEEFNRQRNHPQHFLAVSGLMNESIQQYILSHNYNFSTSANEISDPDHMSYEQLLELGEQIGKVSRGLSKEDIQKLEHRMNTKKDVHCPICQNEVELQELVIELPCRHTYHQECVMFWLKDNNTCPICKMPLSRGKQMRQK